MDELREVKLEDDTEEDVKIQNPDDAPDGSIPEDKIVGRLKRKRVESSEYSNSNFAPSKNSKNFEIPPKLEPRDDEIVHDGSSSIFAPKLEPEEQQAFLEPPPKLEPLDGVQESSSNLAPFFENLLENQVKQEEEPYYPTLDRGFSFSPNFAPREPKEEPKEEQGVSLNLAPFLEMPVKEEALTKYTIWDRQTTSALGSLSNLPPFLGNLMEKEPNKPLLRLFPSKTPPPTKPPPRVLLLPTAPEPRQRQGGLCSLCFKNPSFARAVREKSTRLVLVVGACLSEERMELGAARKFMAGSGLRIVCPSHFRATHRRILEYLQIRSLDETPAPELAQHVTSVVHSICSTIAYEGFVGIVTAFAEEYADLITAPRTKPMPRVLLPESQQRQPGGPNYLCSLCLKTSSFARAVRERNTRLVLVVGACLSEQRMELGTALKFMAGNATKFVCNSHFRATHRRILEYLRIESLDETPAPELAPRVTSLVRTFCSSANPIGYEGFIDIVAAFAEEYSDLIKSQDAPSSATTPNASMEP